MNDAEKFSARHSLVIGHDLVTVLTEFHCVCASLFKSHQSQFVFNLFNASDPQAACVASASIFPPHQEAALPFLPVSEWPVIRLGCD